LWCWLTVFEINYMDYVPTEVMQKFKSITYNTTTTTLYTTTI